MNNIQRLWGSVSGFGITEHHNNPQRLRLKFHNQLLLLLTIGNILSVLAGIATLNLQNILIGLLLTALNTTALYFNYKGYSEQVLKIAIGFSMVLMVFNAFFWQDAYYFFVFLYPFSIVIFFLLRAFTFKWVLSLLFLGAIATTIYFTYQHFPNQDGQLNQDFVLIIISIITTLILLTLYQVETKLYENSLEEKQLSLSQANNLAGIANLIYLKEQDKYAFSDNFFDLLQLDKNSDTDLITALATILPADKHKKLVKLYQHQISDLTVDFQSNISDNWFKLIGNTIASDTGKPQKIILSFLDITNEIHKEQQIKKLLDEVTASNDELQEQTLKLEKSNEELRQFAYISSHDLQEPLRMVGNFVQLLEEEYADKIDAEGKTYIKYAVDGVTRMSALIDDLLEYSKVGKSIESTVKVDLEELIQEKIFDLNAILSEKNGQVIFNNLPSFIYAYPRQLSILFHNLIHNGLKFNTSTTPTITISCEERSDDYLFKVKDNGIGIATKNHQQIFEIFKRLHRKEQYKGTGMGLAIVNRIVEKHNGKIWLDSELGKGTTFYFTIAK